MTIADAVWDGILDSMDAFLNTGTAGSAFIVFQTAADADIASCPLSDPAFGAASAGSMSINAVTTDATPASGTMHHAIFLNRATATAWEVSVGTTASEITFSNVSVSTADSVGLSSIIIAKP